MARGVLVGRDTTIDSILAALSQGRVVVVRGPGGIGKTSVLRMVRAAWLGLSIGAAGVDFLGHQRLLPLERALGRTLLGDVEAVASEVRTSVGSDGLVAIDNLQWADADTIALLPALAARGALLLGVRTSPARGDLEGRLRGELDGQVDGLLDGQLDELEPFVVELATLSDAEARELLQGYAPGLPARSVTSSVRQAAGNPLLLELLARSNGTLDARGEDLVESMLRTLPAEAIELLARGSIGLDIDGAAPGIEPLLQAGLVSRSSDGECTVAAELLASGALGLLEDGPRRTLHLEAADAAEVAGLPAVAAEHRMQAGDRAGAYALALRAIAEVEPEPPAALLLLALEVAPDDERWTLVERATLQLLFDGGVERAGEVAAEERARGRDDPRYDLLDGYVAVQRGDGARAVELLDRMIEEGPAELLASSLALRAGARASLFDVIGARDDAIRVLEIDAGGTTAAAARFVLAGTALLTGDDTWRPQLRQAVEEARRGRSRPLEVRAGVVLAYGLFLSGDRDEAVEVCEELIASAAARRDEQSEHALAKVLQSHLVFRDLAPESVLVALDGLQRHPSTREDLTGGWSVAAIGWADRGQLDRAEDAIAHARIEAVRAGPNGELALSWALAEIAWRQGSPEWCEGHARHGLDQAMLLNPAHANCAALMAWSQLELGRPVDGAVVFLPFPAAAGLNIEIAAVQALAAGDHAGAAELFDEAQGRHAGYFRRSGLRCQWGIAEAQRRAGDLEGALATLKDLEETCARAGITFLDAHIAVSVRLCVRDTAGGRQPDRSRDRGRAQVTARQRQVLSLVHGGLRTPEIAERLGLSPATVDTHIRGAMDRLGVSSRAEAARRVFEAD